MAGRGAGALDPPEVLIGSLGYPAFPEEEPSFLQRPPATSLEIDLVRLWLKWWKLGKMDCVPISWGRATQ